MINKNRRLTIGLVVDDMNSLFNQTISSSARQLCEKMNMNLYIFPVRGPNYTNDYLYQYSVLYDLIYKENIDGVILASSALVARVSDKMEVIGYLKNALDIPLVSMGVEYDRSSSIHSIIIDNSTGINELFDHLVYDHGCKKVAFLKGEENNIDAVTRFYTYKEALKRHGIEYEPNMVFEGNFKHQSGINAARKMIKNKNIEIDAVMCCNDEMALGIINELSQNGIKIPEKVKVTGYDDIYGDHVQLPPLTTVKQPIGKMAEKAIETVRNLIYGEEVSQLQVLPAQMVIRSSCGCLPGAKSIYFINQKEESIKDDRKILEGIKSEADGNAHYLRLINLVERFIAGFEEDDTGMEFLKSLYNTIVGEPFLRENYTDVHNILVRLKEYGKVCKSSSNTALCRIQSILQYAVHITETIYNNNVTTEMYSKFMKFIDSVNYGILSISYQTSEKELINSLRNYFINEFNMENFYISLYDAPVIHNPGESWSFPESVKLVLACTEGRVHANNTDYSLCDQIIPSKYLPSNKPFALIVKPLYAAEEQLGIVVLDYHIDVKISYRLLAYLVSSVTKFTKLICEHERVENELIESNNKLQEIDKQKTDFFSNVSHELRTPLTVIIGYLDSILNESYGSKLQFDDDIFQIMNSNSKRLLNHINDLLEFSKIQEGKMKLNKNKVNINSFLKDYVDSVKSIAERKNINLILSDTSNEIVTAVDLYLFENAIANLLSNAIKFTAEGGIIIVLLDSSDSEFTITVKDTGIGIPEDKISTIFDRFRQVESPELPCYVKGSGIGLAYAKEIVELHLGVISVSSILGRGSTFKITIPFDNADYAQLEGTVSNAKMHIVEDAYTRTEKIQDKPVIKDITKSTVLIIDDNIDLKKYIVSILKDKYNILLASDGKEGLEKVDKYKPDIIISDVMMPVMDGLEFVKNLRKKEENKSIPVIFLTAKTDEETKIKSLEQGAIDFIFKPFNFSELRAKIVRNLELKKNKDDIEKQKDIAVQKSSLLERLVKSQTRELENEKNHAVQLQKAAEKQLEDFMLVLASAIESRDTYTGGHVERVANYSKDIAIEIGLSQKEVRDIYLGAIVHDVGKITIKDNLLNKPGKFIEEEFDEIKLHPEIGMKILSKIENIKSAVLIAYCHQERFDGEGYPQRLKGYDIPLEARIVTVADYWDAITTHRPYREAMHIADALALMNEESGKAFDPELLKVFLDPDNKLFLRYVSKERLKEYNEIK